jgi:hypothetical protein
MRGNSPKQETEPVTSKFGFVTALCTSPIFIVSAYLGDPERGFTAWFSAMMVLVAIRLFWGLRKRAWFWVTIAVIALLHVLLVFFVSWPFPHHLSRIALLPVGLTDLAIAYGIIRLVERLA